jgi:hypothetical protein
MLNSMDDPYLIAQYHQEYLSLINLYMNYKRPGTFIKYYNINYDESIKNPETLSTYDLYNSSIKFDIYDLTPTFNISPIISATTNATDKKGQMFDGVTTITIYTIALPRINDLIAFYVPIQSGELYRVNSIRTSINAYYSDPKLTWYEMDLEVAPIKDTSKLIISKNYIYDLHKEQYFNYEDYTRKTDVVRYLNDYINIITPYYDSIRDYYRVGNLVPMISNQSIIYFKDQIATNDSIRLFNKIVKPYGFLCNFAAAEISHDYQTPTLRMYDIDLEEYSDYVWDREVESPLNTFLDATQNLYNLLHSSLQFF